MRILLILLFCISAQAQVIDSFKFASATTVTDRVEAVNEDAEETISTGAIVLNSTLNLGTSTILSATYHNLSIPAGATIINAKITLQAAVSDAAAVTITITGQEGSTPAVFTTTTSDISSRDETETSVSWSPEAWTAGNDYDTSDISTVIQEIVDNGSYVEGDPIVIIFSPSSGDERLADHGTDANAALLTVTYE